MHGVLGVAGSGREAEDEDMGSAKGLLLSIAWFYFGGVVMLAPWDLDEVEGVQWAS
jgi:hypothetical protein